MTIVETTGHLLRHCDFAHLIRAYLGRNIPTAIYLLSLMSLFNKEEDSRIASAKSMSAERPAGIRTQGPTSTPEFATCTTLPDYVLFQLFSFL